MTRTARASSVLGAVETCRAAEIAPGSAAAERAVWVDRGRDGGGRGGGDRREHSAAIIGWARALSGPNQTPGVAGVETEHRTGA